MPPEGEEYPIESELAEYWRNVNNGNGYYLDKIKLCVLQCMNPEKTLQDANKMSNRIFQMLTEK